MKYAVFLAGLLLLVPAGILSSSYSRRVRECVFFALVFFTAFTDRCDINFLERWWYAGTTRGFEFSIVDLFALILLISTVVTLRREGGRIFWPASLAPMLIYFAYASFTVAVSNPKLFGMFEIVKLLRGMLVFIAVAWFIRSRRDAYILLYALSAVLIYNGCLAVLQRYVWSIYRVYGTFPHSNILGDYCCLTAPLLLAIALSGEPRAIKAFCTAGWTLGAVATILTIARMPSVVFLATSVAVLITSHGARVDARKTALLLILATVVCGIFYRGLDALEERHQADRSAAAFKPEGGRTGFYRVGWMMAKDHPLGVGLNNWGWYYHQYCHWAGDDTSRPYTSTTEPGDGRATQGHTLYGLTLGELGWPGLLISLLLWFRWFSIAGRHFLVRNSQLWTLTGIGCFFGFLAEFLANTTEITFRNQQIFMLFNIMVGLAVAAHRMTFAASAYELRGGAYR